jgi:hypothetical protein
MCDDRCRSVALFTGASSGSCNVSVPSRTAIAALTPSTSATTAAATASTRPLFASAGDVYSQVAPVHICAIQGADGFLGLFLGAHRNKGEPARPAGGAIHHQVRFENGAVRGESVLEIVFGGVEGEISDKQFIIHAVVFFSFLESLVASESVPLSGLQSSLNIAHVTIYHRLKVVSNPTTCTIDLFGEERKTLLRWRASLSLQRNGP